MALRSQSNLNQLVHKLWRHAGDALLFFDMNIEGTKGDRKALHASCPTLKVRCVCVGGGLWCGLGGWCRFSCACVRSLVCPFR